MGRGHYHGLSADRRQIPWVIIITLDEAKRRAEEFMPTQKILEIEEHGETKRWLYDYDRRAWIKNG